VCSSDLWLHSILREGRFADMLRVLRSSAGDIGWRRLLVDDGVYRYTPRWVKEVVKLGIGYRASPPLPALHPNLICRTFLVGATGSSAARPVDSRPAAAIRRSIKQILSTQGFAAARHRYTSRGLELITPYWDRQLVEFVVALPADQLGLPNRDRRVLRNAIKPHLPKAVAQRPPRTAFIPLMKRG